MNLIDRDSLIIKLQNSYCLPRCIKNYNEADKTYSRILDEIAHAEVIYAKPVVHGEWIRDNGTYGKLICSVCSARAGYKAKGTEMGYDIFYVHQSDFCPNCGADMRGRERSND